MNAKLSIRQQSNSINDHSEQNEVMRLFVSCHIRMIIVYLLKRGTGRKHLFAFQLFWCISEDEAYNKNKAENARCFHTNSFKMILHRVGGALILLPSILEVWMVPHLKVTMRRIKGRNSEGRVTSGKKNAELLRTKLKKVWWISKCREGDFWVSRGLLSGPV